MIKLLLILSAFSLSSAQIMSPCRSIFEYGLTEDGKFVGFMNLLIPKTRVYGFEVTQEFASLSSKLRKLPSLRIREDQNTVIENILTGKEIHFETVFPSLASNFMLLSVQMNGLELCSNASSSHANVIQVDVSFSPPSKAISSFKSYFKVALDQPGCGVTNEREKPAHQLSFGGDHVQWAKFPWAASIFIFGEFKCSGNLITRNTVLTAAHCFPGDISFKSIQVKLFNGKMASIWGFLNHNSHHEHQNDLSLVFLEDEITDPDFSPICLTSGSFDPAGKNGDLISFGENEVQQAGQITSLSMPGVSRDECKRSHPRLDLLVEASHFCAGSRDGTGPCEGDSGGGWCVEEGGKWYLRGVLSSGLKSKETDQCDNFNYAIFTDVQEFIPWITSGESAPTPVSRSSARNSLLFDTCGPRDDPSSRVPLSNANTHWLVLLHDREKDQAFPVVPISPKYVLTTSQEDLDASNPGRYFISVTNEEGAWDVKGLYYHDKFDRSVSPTHFSIILIQLARPLPSSVKYFCVEKLQETVHGGNHNGIWLSPGSNQELPRGDGSFTFKNCDARNWVQENNFCLTAIRSKCQLITYKPSSTPDGSRTYWAIEGLPSISNPNDNYCHMSSPSSYFSWLKDTINYLEGVQDEPVIEKSSCGDFGRTGETPDFSWAVKLYNKNSGQYVVAALISPSWVLTSLAYDAPENYYVQTYGSDRRLEVQKVVSEPPIDDNVSHSQRAVALLKLREPLVGHKYFCLDHLATRFNKSSVYGLGINEEASGRASQLTLVTPKQCKEQTGLAYRYMYDSNFYTTQESSLCTHLALDQHSTARGEPYWTLVGVSIYVLNPLIPDGKGVCIYADLAYYLEWIVNKVNSN